MKVGGRIPPSAKRRYPRVEVLPPQRPVSPLELYPYQKAWIDDPSRKKIATKSRRIGYSFGAGLGGVIDCIEVPQKFIVLSRGERQAKEFITDSVAPHCRAIGVAAQFIDEYIPKTSIKKQEVVFDNGSRIIALPANPDTARSYEGNVLLDEFAFHKDAKKIYTAITPSIARGYKLGIISTPNGTQGSYYELAKEAGLVDDPKKADNTWSAHWTDIWTAIKSGFKDRFGNLINAAVLRADCLDEDMWLQEYCAKFLSVASQWIPPELFQRNVDPEMQNVFFGIGGMPIEEMKGRELYGGWDVARNKDLSVIWISEMIGDVSTTRGIVEMSKTPTPQQKREAARLVPFLRRLVIDKSGMGLSIFEDLHEKFGMTVEGVTFTMATKEALAVGIKSRMEGAKMRIPDQETVRYSFMALKKTTTAVGQVRFDAAHDEQHGHSDHFWAAALAESGCAHPLTLGLLDYYKRQQAKREEDMKKGLQKPSTSTLEKPETSADTEKCPECSSIAIVRIPSGRHCNECGWTEAKPVGPQAKPANRRTLMK